MPLRTFPFFLPALPVFFVLHGYRENLGYIHAGDALLLSGIYVLGSLLVFLAFRLLYRHTVKAALAAGFVLAFYFFFGALHDFLQAHVRLLSRYVILLPAFLAAAAALVIALGRTGRDLRRLVVYLNVLFLIYIGIDLAGVVFPARRPRPPAFGSAASGDTIRFLPYSGRAKPDIYFLVFDAYTSSLALKEQYHFDNGAFDRFLASRGFRIQKASRSNYKYTILSIPSILNMAYLDRLRDIKGGEVAEYYYLSDLIRDNDLLAWLRANGYDIVNCSIFDLRGHPSPVGQSLLPLQTRLITDQTLYSRFYRDIGWNFYRFTIDPLAEREIDRSLDNDNQLMGRLLAASARRSARPRFFYGHFNIPHPPYYYDREGRRRKVAAPYRPTDEDSVQDYLDYLPYTNQRAEQLIDRILRNSGGQAVIIFMGDHGLRYHDSLGYNPLSFVQNQNAVYFPGGDYHLFYDSISGVNQFRVILNSLFAQRIPMLKDSIANVKDKK
ncbi:MAG TPA: sulfatase-like hydrolase/transferase [Puia sp.]|nr:sulfatase-like hydrolase/transferase [Puia sp.]